MISKGGFMDFIEDASTQINMADDFIKLVNNPSTKEQNLLDFFNTNRYHGVNLEDCTKLLKAKAAGPLHIDLPPAGGSY